MFLKPSQVTVLVVAYNHERYVRECLESIRTQTDPPARVLVADDMSQDSTRSVIEEYRCEHPGFLEAHHAEQNVGLNRTLNRLLGLVDTEFMTYISADDAMHADRLEKHCRLLNIHSASPLAYSDAEVIDGDSRTLNHISSQEFPWPESAEELTWPHRRLLSSNWIPAASIIMRTEALRLRGGYRDDIFYEDYELLTRLSQGSPFAWTKEPLVKVRRLEDSLGARGFVEKSPRFIKALDAALRNYGLDDNECSAEALARRWELAKRSIQTPMKRRESLKLLWAARQGAGSYKGKILHGAKWALSVIAPRKFVS